MFYGELEGTGFEVIYACFETCTIGHAGLSVFGPAWFWLMLYAAYLAAHGQRHTLGGRS